MIGNIPCEVIGTFDVLAENDDEARSKLIEALPDKSGIYKSDVKVSVISEEVENDDIV